MARSFLKIYFDFDEKTDELTENEKGRLMLALYRYAKTGQKPVLTGNERFLFSSFKSEIDRDIATYNAKIANGNLGGRPAMKEPKENEENLNEPKETEENLNAKNKDKEKEIKKRVSKDTLKESAAFDSFWSAYPRHTNKKAAQQAFQKINPDSDLLNIMLQSVAAWKQSQQWTKDGGQFIPHPATWLNGHRWEDELPKERAFSGKTVTAQQYTQRDYSEEELLAVSDDLIEEARKYRGQTA